MNISNQAAKVRALVVALGITLLAGVSGGLAIAQSYGGPSPNYGGMANANANAAASSISVAASATSELAAAKPRGGKPGAPSDQGSSLKIDPAKQAKAMADAPTVIATAKVACEPVDAYAIASVTYTKPDKTQVKGSLYEIACKAGPGFMATVVSPTEVYQPYTCVLASKVHGLHPESPACALPENVPDDKWLATVAQTFVPGCTVNNTRLVGSTSKEPLIDRYEFGCAASPGGLIDYPQLGTTGKPDYKSCFMVADGGSACTFTTKDQLAASVKPLAAAASPACQVNNVRMAGQTATSDGYFYEFGCANQPGFLVQTKLDNSLVRMIPCAAAAALGGCNFTDTSVATADAKGDYTKALKGMGVTCTVADYNVIGTQANTKRDYVEFKCPEQPWGLIGFVPQPGGVVAGSVADCFLDQVRRKSCTFISPDDLKAQLDKLIKVAQPTKGCDVSDIRYVGESQNVKNALVAELACANKRGYIVAVAADRKSLVETTPCKIAAAHKNPILCEIPGNGTYAADD